MFTGLIDGQGCVSQIVTKGMIRIDVPYADLVMGESIAVNGACLTVSDIAGQTVSFVLSPETLSLTHFSVLQQGSPVNLERALQYKDRLGGHYVLGHVDGLVRVAYIESQKDCLLVRFDQLQPNHACWLLPKGSVTIDGVSLTLNRVQDDQFEVMLVPQTLQETTLSDLSVGQMCQVEFDMLVKSAQQHRHPSNSLPLSPEDLGGVGYSPSVSSLILTASSPIPLSDDGEMVHLHVYRDDADGKEHVAAIFGDLTENEAPLVRLHSECLTGDVLGSIRCDCGWQLSESKRLLQENHGVLLYLRQEGRGIGLTEKIRAYNLQDQGLDTVEANHELGYDGDERNYDVAVSMLQDLGFNRIRLMTNNPGKITQLTEGGIEVIERVPLQVPDESLYNHNYLLTKKTKLGHMLSIENEEDPNDNH